MKSKKSKKLKDLTKRRILSLLVMLKNEKDCYYPVQVIFNNLPSNHIESRMEGANYGLLRIADIEYLLKDYVEMGLVEKLEGNCYKSNSKKDTEINKIIALGLDRIC